MLVLSRLVNETITIDIPPGYTGRIEVTLVATQKGKAKLGVVAPREVVVHRKEIRERIDACGGPSPP